MGSPESRLIEGKIKTLAPTVPPYERAKIADEVLKGLQGSAFALDPQGDLSSQLDHNVGLLIRGSLSR